MFLGQDDELVACGSDDGYVFITSHTQVGYARGAIGEAFGVPSSQLCCVGCFVLC